MGGQLRLHREPREEERPHQVQTLLRVFLQAQLSSQEEGSYSQEEEIEKEEEEQKKVSF